MFSTWKQRIIILIYVFIILSIPVGAYLASQQQTLQSQANEEVDRKIEGPKLTDSTTTTPTKTKAQEEIKNLLTPSPTPDSGSLASPEPSPTTATTFGPTLN